jgi:predicted MFS family arabinose efflux permease
MLFNTKTDFQFGLLIPAWAAADGLGQITLLVMPFMIGALVTELDFGLASAGLVLSIEMGVLSIVALAISPFMGNISRSKLAVAGALIAVLGNSLSIYAEGFEQIAACRGIAGFGYGLALAAGNASVSNSERPERLYEHKMVLFGFTLLLVTLLAPFTVRVFGIRGLFVGLTGMSLLLIPLVSRLPRHTEKAAEVEEKQEELGGFQPTVSIIAVVAIVSALAIFSVREALAWAFVERIGSGLSMSGELVGLLLGLGTLVGLTGPIVATRVRSHVGVARPAIIGTVLSGLITYAIVTASSQFQFGAMALTWGFIYFFTVPLLMGLAAKIDQKGRVIAACSGSLLLAYAAGPAVAGFLTERGGTTALGYFTLVATVVSALLVALTVMHVKKHAIPEPAAAE